MKYTDKDAKYYILMQEDDTNAKEGLTVNVCECRLGSGTHWFGVNKVSYNIKVAARDGSAYEMEDVPEALIFDTIDDCRASAGLYLFKKK